MIPSGLFHRNKHNPSLHLWARSWVNSDEEQPMGGVPDCIHLRDHLNPSAHPETYITSEHSYQKPSGTHERTGEPGAQPAATTPQCIPKEEEVGSTATGGKTCLVSRILWCHISSDLFDLIGF